MGRKKIQISRITDERNRQVTFNKRKFGVMKKAYELSVLCDCEIALIIFSSSNKLYQYASTDMDKVLLKYTEYNEPHESLTNKNIIEALTKKEHKGGPGGSPDDDCDSDTEIESTITPGTEAKYNKIDAEFQLVMQHRNNNSIGSRVLQPGFSSMPVSVPVNSYGSDNSSLEGHHGSGGYQIPVSPGGHLSVDGSSPRPGSVSRYLSVPNQNGYHSPMHPNSPSPGLIPQPPTHKKDMEASSVRANLKLMVNTAQQLANKSKEEAVMGNMTYNNFSGIPDYNNTDLSMQWNQSGIHNRSLSPSIIPQVSISRSSPGPTCTPHDSNHQHIKSEPLSPRDMNHRPHSSNSSHLSPHHMDAGARTPTPQNRLSPMPSDMQMAMSPQQHHHMHQQQQYHHLQQHAVQQHTMQSYHNQTDYDHTSGPMQKRIRVANEIGASWNG